MTDEKKLLWENNFIRNNRTYLEPTGYEYEYPVKIEPNGSYANILFGDELCGDDGQPKKSPKGWWGAKINMHFVNKGNQTVDPKCRFEFIQVTNFDAGYYADAASEEWMEMSVDREKCDATIYIACLEVLADDADQDKNYKKLKRLVKEKYIKNGDTLLMTSFAATNALVEEKRSFFCGIPTDGLTEFNNEYEEFKICDGVVYDENEVIDKEDFIAKNSPEFEVISYCVEGPFTTDVEEGINTCNWLGDNVEWDDDEEFLGHFYYDISLTLKDKKQLDGYKIIALDKEASIERDDKAVSYTFTSSLCEYETQLRDMYEKDGCYYAYISLILEPWDYDDDDFSANEQKLEDTVTGRQFHFRTGIDLINDFVVTFGSLEGDIIFDGEEHDGQGFKFSVDETKLIEH